MWLAAGDTLKLSHCKSQLPQIAEMIRSALLQQFRSAAVR